MSDGAGLALAVSPLHKDSLADTGPHAGPGACFLQLRHLAAGRAPGLSPRAQRVRLRVVFDLQGCEISLAA